MKKFILAGVMALSMAVSSTAFAATITPTYDSGNDTVTIASDLPQGDILTVIIRDASNNIVYIDQGAYGPAIENMAVLVGEGGGLAAGTYTVKVGGTKVPELHVGTFEVSSKLEVTKVTEGVTGGYVWNVAFDKAGKTVTGLTAKFTAGNDTVTGNVKNAGEFLNKYDAEFKIGLKTSKTLSGAEFEMTLDDNTSLTDNTDNI